ncbi:MAG: hypothetical protein A2Y61_07235 [Chloroflexi bacterium RBG_13_60_13]|nr:MAG: hypothetical protein A2Y61_07235 [Chloroflexi bacterium RBG_13_60_13]
MSASAANSGMLSLSSIRDEDLPVLYEWFSGTEETHLWTQSRYPLSLDDFAQDMRQRMQTGIALAIRDTSSGRCIGFGELHEIAPREGTAAFLVHIEKEARSAGLGMLSVLEILTYAFTSYSLRKIYADTYEYNTLASALLRAAGFLEEGRLRKHLWWRDRYWDLTRWAITRKGFEGLAQVLLGGWGLGHWEEAPPGFSRREAQRLATLLASAIAHDGQQTAERPTQDAADAPSQKTGDPAAGIASTLSEPPEIEEHIDMAYSNRDALGREFRWPGITSWSQDQFHEFFAPSGHVIYGYRDEGGRLRAALVCRDEVYAGEKAARLWAWHADPSLDSEARDKAMMQVYVAGARDAISRGRTKVFLFRQANSEGASTCSRLLGEAPQESSVPSAVILAADLATTVERVGSPPASQLR